MTLINSKYIYCLIFIPILISACNRYYDEDDPCDHRIPPISGTNYITFMNTNGDTLQYIDCEEADAPCQVIASDYYNSETDVNLEYNNYFDKRTGHFQVEPLFNGALTFTVNLYLMDSTNSGNYFITGLEIYFDEGYYSGFTYLDNENTKLTITKFGDVFDKIEGSFFSSFINNNNIDDTLNVSCQFSAIHWCY